MQLYDEVVKDITDLIRKCAMQVKLIQAILPQRPPKPKVCY